MTVGVELLSPRCVLVQDGEGPRGASPPAEGPSQPWTSDGRRDVHE